MNSDRLAHRKLSPPEVEGSAPLLQEVTTPAKPAGRLLSFPARPLARINTQSRLLLLTEFLLLFAGLPLGFYFHVELVLSPLPLLWVISAACLGILLRDPTFDRRQLWNSRALWRELPQMLGLFAAGIVVVSVLVRLYAPSLFLILLRTHPRLWAAIMVVYPLLSVYPQGLIYRAWLMHRYRPLFREPWAMILASAVAFAFVHIIFHNWIAVALTLPGGVLFAVRYRNTRSLCASSVEHALYGCFLFTVGLGQFFIASAI